MVAAGFPDRDRYQRRLGPRSEVCFVTEAYAHSRSEARPSCVDPPTGDPVHIYTPGVGPARALFRCITHPNKPMRPIRTAHPALLAALLLAGSACSDSNPPYVVVDTGDVGDTSDVGDVDEDVVEDTKPDIASDADVLDTQDSGDTPDASDTNGIADDTDATDLADAEDADLEEDADTEPDVDTAPDVDVEPDVPVCGDGIREGMQRCDGDDLGDNSCDSELGGRGSLACSDTCELDTSECVACGDGVCSAGETLAECPEECAALSLSLGTRYTCALRADRSVWCWATVDRSARKGSVSPRHPRGSHSSKT